MKKIFRKKFFAFLIDFGKYNYTLQGIIYAYTKTPTKNPSGLKYFLLIFFH